ncbi:MAG: hypothetical protein C3F18_03565 [Nitrosomonadales bacterium]|nr:MAG: hypothetical protein C3F18_03565 [Nitrosomonadales bacterium]
MNDPFDIYEFYRNWNMKKAIQTAVLASLLTSFPAFARHPAEDIIDPDAWEMIGQNMVDADSPHLNLDFTSM